MSFFDTRVHEEQIPAAQLKPKHIIIDTSKGRNEYLQIESISKAKTGKHGSAKVMMVGRNLCTDKKWEDSCKGDKAFIVMQFNKKQYVVEDIFEYSEELWVRPDDNSGIGCSTVSYSDINEEFVKNLILFFEDNKKQAVQVTVISAPQFIKFENIRTYDQNK